MKQRVAKVSENEAVAAPLLQRLPVLPLPQPQKQ
jgi:hypothetical protein